MRAIDRDVQKSPSTVLSYVQLLEKQDILRKRKQGNTIEYSANLDSTNYVRAKRVWNFSQVYESGLVDFLVKKYDAPIVLFGSYARGEDLSTSDIDIAIITARKERFDLTKFEKELHRTINLSLFTMKDVSDEFKESIMNGIVLSGVVRL